MANQRTLSAIPLTAEAFAPFGDVIEKPGSEHFDINDGMATRYHDLASVQTGAKEGHTAINIFHGRPWDLPLRPKMMERHNLGSQAFVPLSPCRWLVVVALPGPFDAATMRAFVVSGATGVNYHPGTWHHPLVAIGEARDFLVVDRVAAQIDCDIIELDEGAVEIGME